MAQIRSVGELQTGTKAQWITNLVHVMLALLFFGHVSHAVDLDGPTSSLWQWAYAQRWCHWAMIEALIAAFSFFSWIVWFRTLNEIPWCKQFRFVPREERTKTIRDLYLAMTVEKPNHQQKRAVRVFMSLPVYLGAILALHFVKDPPKVEEAPPTFMRFFGELAVGIWAYDFLFFWLHVAMHRIPAGRHGHMIHHWFTEDEAGKAKYLEPEAVVNHSLLDGTMQVVINILVQNISLFGTPKHKMTRFVHNMLVTYLLTEAHAGLDLPWLSHRLCPQLVGGAVRHEVHHHTHKHCFQQFFTYLDDLFGLGPPVDTVGEKTKAA